MGGKPRRQPATDALFRNLCSLTAMALLNLQLLPTFAAERLDELPLLMPGATVVLMAGLPGDIESENAYREQMQGLLESIARAGNIRNVIGLSDFNESLHRPDKLEITFLRADRSSFQSLGTILSGATNPIVIIAWGHGGKQGYTPVFHVRGPRITPADFQALSGKLPTASGWVLLFRGSGSFASQLAAAGRAILSSESGTMFNSDPISMQLLVKILKIDPGLAI